MEMNSSTNPFIPRQEEFLNLFNPQIREHMDEELKTLLAKYGDERKPLRYGGLGLRSYGVISPPNWFGQVGERKR